MEAGERPVKKRRLSQDSEHDDTHESIASSKSGHEITKDTREDFSAAGIEGTNGTNRESTATETDQQNVPVAAVVAPLAETITSDAPLSKNQQKKLRKQQEWEAKREDRKVIRKEKITARRERKREARKQLEETGNLPIPASVSRLKSVQLPITLLIDCSFDDLMREPELKSLATQITRSYSDNRHAPFRAHLAVCSFTGRLRKRFDTVLSHYTGWKEVRFLDCDFVEAASKAKEWMLEPSKGGQLAGALAPARANGEASGSSSSEGEVVYLTSEADDTLTELKPYSTYIIGGLVDKNREKGICYKRATQRGIRTAKLPIGQFMEMNSRKVLATNHVNEIMLKWLECGDWAQAFMTAIPKRKGGTLKGDEPMGNGDGEDDDQDVEREARADGEGVGSHEVEE